MTETEREGHLQDEREEDPEVARSGRPAWQAPIAGAILLMLLGVRFAYKADREITLEWLAGFAAAGVLIGLLVALCDGPGPGTLYSRFLALVSPVTMVPPVIGVERTFGETTVRPAEREVKAWT